MAVTKSSNPKTLKIWSLEDYTQLLSLSPDDAEKVMEVRFGEKLVMLISKVNQKIVNFEVYDPH